MQFANRREAGQKLATALAHLGGDPGLIVLALPRGGVPVAYEVARALHAPLDIWLVRKIGAPGQEELAAGAIATGGIAVWNREVLQLLGIDARDLAAVVEREQRELDRRRRAYCGDHPAPELKNCSVILIDDGIATGASVRAAVQSLRQAGARRIVVATPVAPEDACRRLREIADAVICLYSPEPFRAIGLWYRDFDQTSDAEVLRLLNAARNPEAEDSP